MVASSEAVWIGESSPRRTRSVQAGGEIKGTVSCAGG